MAHYKASKERRDVHAEITAQIIADLKAGAVPREADPLRQLYIL